MIVVVFDAVNAVQRSLASLEVLREQRTYT